MMCDRLDGREVTIVAKGEGTLPDARQQGKARRNTLASAPVVILAILVLAAVLLTHWPVLSATALSFDDGQYVTNNDLVMNPSIASAWRFLTEVLEPSTVQGYYQPLPMISLMLDYAAGGRPDSLRAFHVTSLTLHVLNTALLILVLHLLFNRPWAAALAGLLYGVHPLTVEPVAWLSDRKTLLATLFSLASVIFFVRSVRRPGWKSYLASLASYLLALMSKPTSLPLPFLLVLLDAWPLHRINQRPIREKLPFFALGAVFASIVLTSQGRTASIMVPDDESIWHALLKVFYLCAFYLHKVLWPTEMSGYYLLPRPFSLANLTVLLHCLATCVLVIGLLAVTRWTIAPLVGCLFFFVAIFPTLGIIGFTNVSAADKFAYLPVIGLLLPLACLVAMQWGPAAQGPRPKARRVAIGVIACGLGLLEAAETRRCLGYWQESERLFRHMLKMSPQVWQPHNSLADSLVKKRRIDEALFHYAIALRLNPDAYEAQGNLAGLLLDLGRTDEAVKHYRAAARLRPDKAEVHYGLAMALIEQGSLDEGITQYDAAIRIKPDYRAAYYNLAGALARRGHVARAIASYQAALALEPSDCRSHYNMALLLTQQGRLEDSIHHFRAAVQFCPDFPNAHNNLAFALQSAGDDAGAVAHYREALRFRPDFVHTRINLAAALQRQGDLAGAVNEWQAALQLDPQLREARVGLADALLKLSRLDEAEDAYRKAIEVNADDPHVHFGLGRCLEERQLVDEAAGEFERVLELDAGHAEAADRLRAIREKKHATPVRPPGGPDKKKEAP